jgi:NADH:ubiquinone oxidoreductase subunit F (NADH-binding)/NADH:ubiquinone oxidoreductase subunit E
LPGQTVTELERRYGRPAEEVLDRLRRVKASRGRIAAEDVDRVAAETDLPRAHVNGAASFYADLGFGRRGNRHVCVCDGTACFAASCGKHVEATAAELGAPAGGCSEDGEVSLQPVYCLGYCYGGPSALDGEAPRAGPDLVEQLAGRAEPRDPEIPFRSACAEPVVLAGLAGSGPEPWGVWRRALSAAPERILAAVLESGLRGRGGAGFPVGRKWQATAAAASSGPRYVVCNGDEGDPGSYVDRLLMESDPHRLLAGMALAALATGAEHGYVYVRSEYPRARDRLRRAVEEARAEGSLGSDVAGSGIDLDIEVFEGAGSYVAGEETSLMHSVEGLRGEVAVRPPYPTERGLFHQPSLVNNVETLCAVPWIVARGGAAYAALGAGESRGTKVVCLNERFRNPGAYEVELGVTLRWICEELGGGLVDGRSLRSLQVGGPLGGFLGPEQLDTPLAFDSLREAGVDLGHGSLVAVDDRVRGPELLRHVWTFAASESCGTCVPCRIGTRRGLEAAEGILSGRHPDPAEYASLLETMGRGSLCAFGRGVPQAVSTLARAYPDELGPIAQR